MVIWQASKPKPHSSWNTKCKQNLLTHINLLRKKRRQENISDKSISRNAMLQVPALMQSHKIKNASFLTTVDIENFKYQKF